MPRRLCRSCAALGFNTYEVVDMNDLDLMAADFKRARARRRASAGGRPLAAEQRRRRAICRSGTQAPPSLRARVARGAPRESDRGQGWSRTAAWHQEHHRHDEGHRSGSDAQQGTVETVTYLEYPNHVRVESKTARGETVQAYDGSRAWVKDPMGIHDVPEPMVRDLEANLRRDTVAALLAATDGRLTARQLIDARDENGGLRYALELSGPDLDPTILYVDPETSLIVKQSYVAGGRGTPLVEEVFTRLSHGRRRSGGVRHHRPGARRIGARSPRDGVHH